jgi:hypothetical protein
VSGLYVHPCSVMVCDVPKVMMRKIRKVPRISSKALLSFPSIRLRGDSAEDMPNHQIVPLETAEDYLMVPCHYADDWWGYVQYDWQFKEDAESTRVVYGVHG